MSNRKEPFRDEIKPMAMSVDTAAEVIGIGRSLLRSRLRDGTGPRTVKIGKRRLITPEALQEWLLSLEEAA